MNRRRLCRERRIISAAVRMPNSSGTQSLVLAKPSAYDLCMKLGAKNILIVTNRPAIANSWYQDYETFFGPQSGYLFVSNVDGIKDRKFVYSREGIHSKAR